MLFTGSLSSFITACLVRGLNGTFHSDDVTFRRAVATSLPTSTRTLVVTSAPNVNAWRQSMPWANITDKGESTNGTWDVVIIDQAYQEWIWYAHFPFLSFFPLPSFFPFPFPSFGWKDGKERGLFIENIFLLSSFFFFQFLMTTYFHFITIFVILCVLVVFSIL